MVTRFAPAPTGFLHLGHVLNAIWVWGLASAADGRVLLRIEDHDRQRSRREYESAILEDLEWLGFIPDDPPFAAFRSGVCHGRQSDRTEGYEAALAKLHARGLIYACECSRKEIAAAAGDAPGDEPRYPGTCANKNLPLDGGLGLRVRLAPSVERFDDGLKGPQEQQPSEQCGDMLVRDREGNWTYQFVATVDDFAQGITDVIRGEDLLPSTGRQIQLARLLGRDVPPRFVHHGLIMRSPTQKLSKSDGDSGVRDLRARGWSAEEVIGEAARLGGLTNGRRPIAASHASTLVRH